MKYKDNITGVLNVYKPKGLTSYDVVDRVQKILNTKAGHTGTLDPLATGVLVVTLGKATKLSELLTSSVKEYEASMILGLETDTLDTEGEVLNEKKSLIDKDKIIDSLNSFKGIYNQEVPKYSAVKIDGKKLYEYAREGIFVKLPKRDVQIFDIKLLDFYQKDDKTFVKFYVKVSKGTYIRSLIRDIAYSTGTIGVMSDLVRISQGNFKIESSYTLDDIENGNYKILEVKDLGLPFKMADESLKKKILNGVPIDGDEDILLFLDSDGNELAIYKNQDGMLRMYKMLYQTKH